MREFITMKHGDKSFLSLCLRASVVNQTQCFLYQLTLASNVVSGSHTIISPASLLSQA